jgi:phosphatidylinositol alpha-1,6-mannosyltransferase
MLGHVAPDDLPRWYNACDVFAMPNREINGDNEGFGMVFIEAAACGKPSLAGKDGGTGSAVIDGVTGLRVDGNDMDAVAEGLRFLLSSQNIVHEFGQAGLARVMQEFDWKVVTEKTRRLKSRS